MTTLPQNDMENSGTYKISWIHGLVALVVMLVSWLIMGTSAAVILNLIQLSGTFSETTDLILDIMITFSPFLCLAFGIWVSLKYILHMPLKQFVTDAPRFRWNYVWIAFLLCLITNIIVEAISYFNHPQQYLPLWNQNWTARLISLPFLFIFISIQTTCEELMFRCLPARVICGKLPQKFMPTVLLSTMSAALFVLPHMSNRDFLSSQAPWAMITFYAMFGFGAMASAIVTGGFELAFGMHAANNLYVALFCNYEQSPIPSMPLLLSLDRTASWDSNIRLAVTFALLAIVCLIIKRKQKQAVI